MDQRDVPQPPPLELLRRVVGKELLEAASRIYHGPLTIASDGLVIDF
jgi:hypothetical protein